MFFIYSIEFYLLFVIVAFFISNWDYRLINGFNHLLLIIIFYVYLFIK